MIPCNGDEEENEDQEYNTNVLSIEHEEEEI